MRTSHAVSVTLAIFFSFCPTRVGAQEADPVDAESEVGYELALHGGTYGERGTELRVSGVAYEVLGLDDLRPMAGLEVAATVTAYRRDGTGRDRLPTTRVRTGEGGRFEVAIPVPSQDLPSPQVEIVLARPGRPGRTFRFALGQLAPRNLELLTDRNRYQPGETVRVWSLLRTTRGRAPVSGAPITIRLTDDRGNTVAERVTESSAGGVATAELVVPATADTGRWNVRVIADPATPEAQRAIAIVHRTVERLEVTVTLDRELFEPGQRLQGRVRVATPSGSPVRGAQVLLTVGDDDAEPLVLTTDDAGEARIEASAPSFLSGDVATRSVVARVTHPAYGTLVGVAPYTLARTRWLVTSTPEAGGLVPEVDSEVFLSVADPRGRPIIAGTELEIRGLGLPNGRAVVTTDAHGIAVATVRLPRGAAARMRGGACGGQPSASLEVEVRSTPLVVARICVAVALDAQLLARVRAPIVAPGGRVEVDVQRRPAIAGQAVLLEALWGDRAIAFAWIDGSARTGAITLPTDVQGSVRIRARPIAAAGATAALDLPGATVVQRGSIAGLLVRPADAFALEVTPDRELHRVRERAEIAVRATVAPERGWVALLARDEAAHGGEGDFSREWIAGEIRDVIRGPIDPAHERFLRSAISAGLPMDSGVAQPPPLVREPWDSGGAPWTPARSLGGGVLRDPIAAREELRRRGLGAAMMAVESAIARLGDQNDAARASLLRASGRRVELHPDAIAWLVRSGQLAESQARTLGGQRLEIGMLTRSDPSFTFDRVARRVARQRLVRLLVALATFASPDDPAAARASAGQPPDRWLARLVPLGLVPSAALIDPWGRPFAFRRITGRRPTLVVSERAIDFELASPGPDGVLGNADDVRDPFERVVPQRTPYAVVSGEDRLLEQLSRLAPGQRVLDAMAGAYARLGLAAEEERRRGPVTAAVSEAEPSRPSELESPSAEMAYDDGGEGGGGYRMGGVATGAAAQQPAAPPPARTSSRGRPDQDADGILDSDDREEENAQSDSPAGDRLAAMGELVREDFPATLFFVGEVPLDASGNARITLPLADALTTYRLEAIGWSGSGWITSGRTRVRVDQDAMVDAPVPAVTVIGDVVRVPVRLQNRSAEPLRARIEIAVEGGVAIDVGTLAAMDVAPGAGAESILELRPRAAGEGAIVIRAVREDGTPLDAVRRPIRVAPDARRVIERREELVGAGGEIVVDVPLRALPRGPAQLRLAVAGAIVGDPAVWAESSPIWAGWALAMAERPLTDIASQAALQWIRLEEFQDERRWYGADPLQLAAALAVTWRGEGLSEHAGRAALRFLASQIPEADPSARTGIIVGPVSPSWLLIALAPAIAAIDARPELRDDFTNLVDRLRRLASAEGAQAIDAPATWARVAAGLELSRRGATDARAQEMLRRIERHVIAVGDEAWLEPDQEDGTAEPRIEPTALLALARIADGDPGSAIALIRNIAGVARGAERWDPRARALASAAAARVARGPIESVRVLVDGAPIEVSLEGGIATASIDGLAQPGHHTVSVVLPAGALALATLELRYALPWDVRPSRDAPIDLEWTGEIGARDVRSGLLLNVRNRGARVLARPIVEIELPAGAELDEPTRERLSELLAAPVEIEGATMRLRLRPMAPGGFARIPIRARWSVGGALRGLGVSAWDEVGPSRADVRPVRVLPSREVTLADHGEEPDALDAEASEPPRPPPIPLPILRPLAEVAR